MRAIADEGSFTAAALALGYSQPAVSQMVRRLEQRTGTVLSFTTVYRAPLPVFKDMVPYVIAIVDLDEGFRVMANALPQVQQGALQIGARVRIGVQEVQGMALPVLEALRAESAK